MIWFGSISSPKPARFVAKYRSMPHRRTAAPLRDSLISDCSTPSNAAVRDEESAALYRALEKIRPDQAAAIRMRHLEGMPLDEIARKMIRSTNAVSQLILRGMMALKPLLEEDHLGYCRVRTNRS